MQAYRHFREKIFMLLSALLFDACFVVTAFQWTCSLAITMPQFAVQVFADQDIQAPMPWQVVPPGDMPWSAKPQRSNRTTVMRKGGAGRPSLCLAASIPSGGDSRNTPSKECKFRSAPTHRSMFGWWRFPGLLPIGPSH